MKKELWNSVAWRIAQRSCILLLLASGAAWGQGVDLLRQYPTKLTAGDVNGEQARPWDFTAADVFHLTRFNLEVGKALKVQTGPADLAVGHCVDGAVWAVLLPGDRGQLTSSATNSPEAIAHVWLRFHPGQIARLFPAETVSAPGDTNLQGQIRAIAGVKFFSSWHAGDRAMIPEPKDMTVDVDTKGGPRRFFVVDTQAQTAEYVAAFEKRSVRPPPRLTPALAGEAFDKLWKAFDEKYAMFVLRPDLDWAKLREQYRPKALASKSAYDFAAVCANMLKSLRDLHVWMTVAGANVPVFNRVRAANANPQGCRAILRDLAPEHGEQGEVAWAVTTNHIGYIAVYGWSNPRTPELCAQALEQMRDTRGLIVDVRLNGGGDEPMAGKFAGRFLDKEFIYAYSQFRNGPSHTNLTEKYPRTVSPLGPWRYNRPVLLLIGQKCMSSNESFIGMMTGDPELTTMGDHTCGSSGNPMGVKLPMDITVSVPRWIDYLPDGTPLDERGFQPQVPFHPGPGAFEGERDDLLTAALERLGKAPLPDKPIEGPAYEASLANLRDRSRAIKEEAQDATRPHVVAVWPTNDASAVSLATELRIRFDRPMDPLSLKLNWEAGGFLDCDYPRYDAAKYEFVIPVRLAPGQLHQLLVNATFGGTEDLSRERKQFPRDGFQTPDHRLAGLFAWRFRTAAAPIQPRATPPTVRSLSPAPGSQVPFRTVVEIQFDQPMAPLVEAAPALVAAGERDEVRLIAHIEYDAERHLFRIPLLLPPEKKASFTLTGFRSAEGAAARPIPIQYQVSGEELTQADQQKQKAAAQDPQLLALLTAMKQKRSQLSSLAERVQTLQLGQHEGLFSSLESKSASFKWQKPNQYYGDVSQIMMSCTDFRIGSDGQQWWWHSGTDLIVCPIKDMDVLNISLCDPFDLLEQAPAGAAADLGLKYLGLSQTGGAECLDLEAWQIDRLPQMTPFGSLFQWHIDRHEYRPVELTAFSADFVFRYRFLYDVVNQPLPPADFARPSSKALSPVPPEALDAKYTQRFVNLRDGADGRMSVRWGKIGPGGRSSSGLN